MVYQRAEAGPDSLRIDIPKNDVPAHSRCAEGIKYVVTERKEGKDPQHVMREPGRNFFPHLQVISEVVPKFTSVKEILQKRIEQTAGSLR
jgi:hypothetical protein